MKKIGHMLDSGKLGATGPMRPLERSSAIQGSLSLEAKRQHERDFAQAYRILYSFGFISFQVDDTDYRIWEQACSDLTSEELIHGAQESVNFKGRWFRINDFRALCQKSPTSLPDAHDAYVEACMADSPKDQQEYSHPAVYYAGKAAGFGYLAANPEREAYPRFRAFYEDLLKRVANGEKLEMPLVERIEHKPQPSTPDSPYYRAFKERMKKLGLSE